MTQGVLTNLRLEEISLNGFSVLDHYLHSTGLREGPVVRRKVFEIGIIVRDVIL